MPDAEQRKVDISVTALDRLRSDPYQFYAAAILALRRAEALDEEPSPAWQGTIAHRILQQWHEQGGRLHEIARQVLRSENPHPLIEALWLPRLLKALDWVEETIGGFDGREIAAVEESGSILFRGVRVHGRADRIDRLADGTLAIVDYKTGSPPSAKQVEEGFSLQLGLVGLMAREGGFASVAGEPSVFEYWSLGRKAGEFGYVASPVKAASNRAKLLSEEFVGLTENYLGEAVSRWILGEEPFIARLNPDLPSYDDYDQLMRLDEWMGREDNER